MALGSTPQAPQMTDDLAAAVAAADEVLAMEAADPGRVYLTGLSMGGFHGADDTVVLPGRSRSMIAAMEAAGGAPRYTEYAGVGHDSWTPAYRDPAVLDWLFAQRKGMAR